MSYCAGFPQDFARFGSSPFEAWGTPISSGEPLACKSLAGIFSTNRQNTYSWIRPRPGTPAEMMLNTVKRLLTIRDGST
jgi:hypothetical protein